MSTWNMGSKPYTDGTRDLVINFTNDDSNGQMTGTLTFKKEVFTINGDWAAEGSVPGRNYSAFGLSGSDQSKPTVYVAAVGTMVGPGVSPDSILINLVRSSTDNGQQYGWDGELTPL